MYRRSIRLALVGACSIAASMAAFGCGDSLATLCRGLGKGPTAEAAVEAFYVACDKRVNEIKPPVMLDEATANFAVERSGTIRFVTARRQPDGSWLVAEENTGP